MTELEFDDPVEAPVALVEKPRRGKAPVSEIMPLISAGDWVRLRKAKGVPERLVGRLAVVTFALAHTAPGGDVISDRAYEYQLPGDAFNVRVRETGDVLNDLTREAFASYGPTEGDVERYQRG